MADTRKEFVVDVNGIEHTMLLTPEDAEALYGENAKAAPKAPANKARSVANKAADGAGDAD